MDAHPRRRATDSVEDHHTMWKYIASFSAGASIFTMILLSIFTFTYTSSPSSPEASLEMFDKYKDYSTQYADNLYTRVGAVTDMITIYKRNTGRELGNINVILDRQQELIVEMRERLDDMYNRIYQLEQQGNIANTNNN